MLIEPEIIFFRQLTRVLFPMTRPPVVVVVFVVVVVYQVDIMGVCCWIISIASSTGRHLIKK
jgi:hypothetical protein